MAEAKALLLGLQRCYNEGVMQVNIEGDSLLLVQILIKKIHPPWRIKY